jgi:hypothetical protein
MLGHNQNSEETLRTKKSCMLHTGHKTALLQQSSAAPGWAVRLWTCCFPSWWTRKSTTVHCEPQHTLYSLFLLTQAAKKKDLSVHAKGSQVQSNMPFEYTKCFASSSCNLRTTQIWWTFSYRKKKTCKDITCLCFFHMTCQMWASREATGSHSFCKCM